MTAPNDITAAQEPSSRVAWLLGLPFDRVTMDEAIARIDCAIREREQLSIATPNLNFVAMAAVDPVFRNCVLDAQLSLADGMPIVVASRLLGSPLPGRVSGSSLFQRLAERRLDTPLKVFFFGGDPGIGELASARLPTMGQGLVGVGHLSPGFGSIESMSSQSIIQRINSSGAEILVVAIGARKGHEWIARNRRRLSAPVITYLGATINFVAGVVRRAPEWMQRTGLEWLWRTGQEPKLARRYLADGMFLARHLMSHLKRGSDGRSSATASLDIIRQQGINGDRWELVGELVSSTASMLAAAVGEVEVARRPFLVIDLSALSRIDSTGMGLLYSLRSRRKALPTIRFECQSGNETSVHKQTECLWHMSPYGVELTQS
jgi:N-acetylglucosaminyldiphosphoundecaprenol N-acetyl-beta-D-mannosaminyltransferase